MSALLLSSPERMYRVRVIAPKGRAGEALAALQRAGTLHVREIEVALEKPAVETRIREVEGLAKSLDEILSRAMPSLPAQPPAPAEGIESILLRPFEELKGRAAELAAEFKERLDQISALERELKGLEGLHMHLARAKGLLGLKLRDLSYEGDYLFSMLIAAKAETLRGILEGLGGDLLLYESFEDPEGGATAYILARASARKKLLSELEAKGIEILRLPKEDLSVGDFLLRLGERIEALRGKISKIEEGFRDLVPNWAEVLMLRSAMAWELDRLSVLARALETGHLAAIEGWVPESGLRVTSGELEPLGYVYYDYEEADPGEEPPTKLRNWIGVRPFEAVINFFGTPKYTEWDPTPITAYSFAIFYGMMLGDAIYGLGLILAARLLLKRLVDDPDAEGFKLFRNMLYVCGGAAIAFGILAGSYLGDAYEFLGLRGILGPVIRQLSEPLSLIVVSLGIGLIHVNVAHALSAVKGIKEGDKALATGRVGLFIAESFGIIYVMHKFFDVRILPFSADFHSQMIYPSLIGIGILATSMIKQSGGLGGMLWVFELTGLMGDILSYSRLAGVGMASFFLASAFNQMAMMAFKGISGAIPGIAGMVLGAALSILVAAFAHLLNLALSCLGAFIHSMRLCFVEFLPKFYNGGGRPYSPFKAKVGGAVTLSRR
ncbi:MAG: V-type ATPase 116kDa subunit family protein [Candidatus Bathyarchaeia archaeon]